MTRKLNARPNDRTCHAALRRRGSVYVAVLGVTMIAAMCALLGMRIARQQLKATGQHKDHERAKILAHSAAEQAVAIMNNHSWDVGDWRANFTSGVETPPITFGGGEMSFKLIDEDGELADDPSDPVWIHGIGRVGDAVYVARARARIDAGLPLEFLRAAVHCGRTLSVKTGVSLAVTGAAASTDAEVINEGTIDGSVEAVSLSGSGTVTGTATVPAERKGMPWVNTFSDYVARATQLPYNGDIDTVVMAPGVNEYGGGLNADGVYYIDTGGNDIDVRNSRIHGTLLIDAGPNNEVVIEDQCLIHPYRDDFPSLIIRANNVELELKTKDGVRLLREPPNHHNFNPPGAPYQGHSDSDTVDQYPSGIRGLAHLIADVTIEERILVRGCVVVEGDLEVQKKGEFIHDPHLMLNPPRGYTDRPDSTDMIIEARSWARHPAP
ncbi:MAG: hypothetical protein ACQESR_23685 [Planctomycetota bacterium]